LEEVKGGNLVVDLVVEEKVALSELFLRCFVSMMIKRLGLQAASRDLIPSRRIDCRIVRLGSGLHPISFRMGAGFSFL
jgi:hypothetical protein